MKTAAMFGAIAVAPIAVCLTSATDWPDIVAGTIAHAVRNGKRD